jgi:hypothetical protein
MNYHALCFVDMPFGQKSDPKSGVLVAFDHIYNEAIKPAIEARAGSCHRSRIRREWFTSSEKKSRHDLTLGHIESATIPFKRLILRAVLRDVRSCKSGYQRILSSALAAHRGRIVLRRDAPTDHRTALRCRHPRRHRPFGFRPIA